MEGNHMTNEGTGQKLQEDALVKHSFTIFKNNSSDKKHRVHPSSEDVKQNQILEWTPQGTAVQIFFPEINGSPVVENNPLRILADTPGSTKVILSPGSQDVDVHYAVYCEATNEFAKANSDPKIIVRP